MERRSIICRRAQEKRRNFRSITTGAAGRPRPVSPGLAVPVGNRTGILLGKKTMSLSPTAGRGVEAARGITKQNLYCLAITGPSSRTPGVDQCSMVLLRKCDTGQRRTKKTAPRCQIL